MADETDKAVTRTEVGDRRIYGAHPGHLWRFRCECGEAGAWVEEFWDGIDAGHAHQDASHPGSTAEGYMGRPRWTMEVTADV